jgi:hypothetical protein
MFGFVIGQPYHQKTTWFLNHFRKDGWDQIHWVVKAAEVRDRWGEWWKREQVFWKKRSNHPNAFWNIGFHIPEIWVIRVYRPDCFWGTLTSTMKTGRPEEIQKCFDTLQRELPVDVQRMLFFVLDDHLLHENFLHHSSFEVWNVPKQVKTSDEDPVTVYDVNESKIETGKCPIRLEQYWKRWMIY